MKSDRPDEDRAIAALTALGHQTRLRIFRELIRRGKDGLAAGEITEIADAPASTISTNLSVLLQAGLVRNEREGRSIRYFADFDGVRRLMTYLMEDCCGCQPGECASIFDSIGGCVASADDQSQQDCCAEDERLSMRDNPINVLFLCTANSARSLIAEAILNADPSGRFKAYSAGSFPSGEPNPRTIQLLTRLGYDLDGVRSKSWDEFAGDDAPVMDFVFTVCDNAAGETCPIWPGRPVTAHWGVPDPAAVKGNEAEEAAAFNRAHQMLSTRLAAFTSLPVETLERGSLQARLAEIGRSVD